jgi:hypothetical protein
LLGRNALSNDTHYSLKRWPALARIADDDDYPIDNNPIEKIVGNDLSHQPRRGEAQGCAEQNAIRPIALGRKNCLFTGSASAGQRAASIMSLVATAKANDIEPNAWLTDILTQLPTTRNRDIDSPLPIR